MTFEVFSYLKQATNHIAVFFRQLVPQNSSREHEKRSSEVMFSISRLFPHKSMHIAGKNPEYKRDMTVYK